MKNSELLNAFGKDWSKETEVVKFIDTLLSCRYLFDKYVIKSSTLRAEDEHWSLWNIVKGNSSNYYYKNTFGNFSFMPNDIRNMFNSRFNVENIDKIDKKYENFAIRLKEIAENNRKREKYLLSSGFIQCSECGKIFYPGGNEKICFNCYDRKESKKIEAMVKLLTEMPLIGERDAVRRTGTDAYTYYKVRDMLAQRVYSDLFYFCMEKNLQIQGNEEWRDEIRKETIVDFEIYVKNYIDLKIGTDNMEIFSKERKKLLKKLNNDRRFKK